MPRTSPRVSLAQAEREQLEQWVAAHGTPQQVALRCRIVLAAAAGETNLQIGAACQIDVKTVALWRGRFMQTGPQGLWEIASGRGRKPTYSVRKIKAIVQATLLSKPEAMTQWSCRQMAQAQGVSKPASQTCSRPSRHSWRPGTKIPTPWSGPKPSSRSSPSLRDVARLSSKSSLVVPRLEPEKGKSNHQLFLGHHTSSTTNGTKSGTISIGSIP